MPTDDLDAQDNAKVLQRRKSLANLYKTLPAWGTQDFWRAVEQGDFPLEILVKLTRQAIAQEDYTCEKRCLTLIILRLQNGIQSWALQVMKKCSFSEYEERQRLAADLSSDLYEAILRAILDQQRRFWEENFLHCLLYERRHVKRAFLMREGRWYDSRVSKSRRIPHSLIFSLDRPMFVGGQGGPQELEDEHAYLMLLSVEVSDLAMLVACMPERLRRVVQLMFWEDRTEKDAALELLITDRTVRNRLQAALNWLRREFIIDQGEQHPFLP